MMRRLMSFLALICLLAAPALAVEPDEMLKDPGLEARARAISAQIRCPVCQGESIDDSDAPISRDLRLLIRERLVAGDSDQTVIDFITRRYGEQLLFRPPMAGVNLILWGAGPVLFLGGVAIALAARRRRPRAATATASPPAPDADLSEAEKTRLAQLLAD